MGVSLGELRPDWSPADWPELAALGARCLAQQPEDRPSFRELAEELVRLEEGLRVSGAYARRSTVRRLAACGAWPDAACGGAYPQR